MITQTRTAHAVQINRYGPPEVLTYSEVLLVPLSGHEVRIKTLVAPVNHTDLEIRAGNWPVTKPDPFPYVPDVEALGVIEEVGESVRGWARGQNVITMMQGLGGVRGERPGSYAEFVTVDAEAVAEIPADVDPVQMAAFHQGDPPSRLSDHATIRGGPRAPAHGGGPCEGAPAADALPTRSRIGEPFSHDRNGSRAALPSHRGERRLLRSKQTSPATGWRGRLQPPSLVVES